MMVRAFDARIYDAPRYRITQVGARPTARISSDGSRILSWPFGMYLFQKLLPGIPVEFNRADLLRLLVSTPSDLPGGSRAYREALGMLFTEDRLTAEAWIDGRWVTVSLMATEAGLAKQEGISLADSMREATARATGHKPGVAEAAYHLEAHAKRNRQEVPEILREAGYEVHEESLPRWIKNGRKRSDDGKPCRFDLK